TEQEWQAAEDSMPMLRFLRHRNPSKRKIHLFVCGYCRCFHWDALRSKGLQAPVEMAERFADGLATEGELRAARERVAREPWAAEDSPAVSLARIAVGALSVRWEEGLPASLAIRAAMYLRGPRLWEQRNPGEREVVRSQCALLRDIFAPFATPA